MIRNKNYPERDLIITDQLHEDIKLGYMNNLGKVIVKPIFTSANNFSDGLAAVKNEERKWGFINKDGTYAIEPRFDVVCDFSEGYAPVILNIDNSAEYSYIDKKGSIAISPNFISPSTPSEGLILGTQKDFPGRLVCIDYKGHIIFSIKGDSARWFKEGMAPYMIDKKWGFIKVGLY